MTRPSIRILSAAVAATALTAPRLARAIEPPTIYDNYQFGTEVLVASIRHPIHVVQSAMMGAHVATMPPKVLWQMTRHPLTDKGIEGFLKDWAATGQKIG